MLFKEFLEAFNFLKRFLRQYPRQENLPEVSRTLIAPKTEISLNKTSQNNDDIFSSFQFI